MKKLALLLIALLTFSVGCQTTNKNQVPLTTIESMEKGWNRDKDDIERRFTASNPIWNQNIGKTENEMEGLYGNKPTIKYLKVKDLIHHPLFHPPRPLPMQSDLKMVTFTNSNRMETAWYLCKNKTNVIESVITDVNYSSGLRF